MDAWLQCEVGKGQFPNEFAVQGRKADGKKFSAFVPDEFVKCEHSPVGWEFVPGKIKVKSLETKNDKTLVQLPREAFEDGYYISVSAAFVH
jgi:hypothetical protein